MSLFRFVFLMAWLVPAAVFGQDASVTGVVTDSFQALIPGVHITVRNVDTDIARTLITDQEGNFTITSLPPGKYSLKAEHAGFQGYERTGIVLELGQTLRANIEMAVGSVSETVQVTA